MKVGICDVYNGVPMPHQLIYEKILKHNNIDYEVISFDDRLFWEQLLKMDYVLYRWPNNDNQHQISGILRPIFETLKIKYLPNYNTSWHYDDKVKQYFLFELIGKDVGAISVPTSIIFSKKKALEFIKSCSYPIVAKLNKGAGSSNVRLIKSYSKANKYVKKSFSRNGMPLNDYDSFFKKLKLNNYNFKKTTNYFLRKVAKKILNYDESYWQKHKNYVLFQKFLDGNRYDTRVTTVGDRVHAFRRFARKDDFRASGGEEWDINPSKIDKRMLRIALDFSRKMNFTTMAYDFIYDENNEPHLIEMSYMFGQPGFPDFMNGYWDFDLNWHEGRYWPQYFELVDFLGIPTLKCPEITIPKEWVKNTII